MYSVLREILSCCCFIVIVYLISYSNRNTNSFLQVNHLRHYFLNIGRSTDDFTKVSRKATRRTKAIYIHECNRLDSLHQ